MSTTGKGSVISSQTSVKVVVSMIATSSVHKIIPASDTITSPSPTSQGPETEEPKTEEPETGRFIKTVNLPTSLLRREHYKILFYSRYSVCRSPLVMFCYMYVEEAVLTSNKTLNGKKINLLLF